MNATDAHAAYFDLMDDATAEAAVAYEDGDMDAVRAFLADATGTQRRHLNEEIAIILNKRARAAEYAPRRAPSTRAARNAAAAWKDGSHAAEGRILARQGY